MSQLPEKHYSELACADGTVQLPGRSVLEALTDDDLRDMVAGEFAASAAQAIRTGWVLMEAKRRARSQGIPWEQWLTAHGWQQSKRWADHCIKTTTDYLNAAGVEWEVTSHGAIEVALDSAEQAAKVLSGQGKGHSSKPPKPTSPSAPASPSDRVRGASQGTVDGPTSSGAGAEGPSRPAEPDPDLCVRPGCGAMHAPDSDLCGPHLAERAKVIEDQRRAEEEREPEVEEPDDGELPPVQADPLEAVLFRARAVATQAADTEQRAVALHKNLVALRDEVVDMELWAGEPVIDGLNGACGAYAQVVKLACNVAQNTARISGALSVPPGKKAKPKAGPVGATPDDSAKQPKATPTAADLLARQANKESRRGGAMGRLRDRLNEGAK